MSPNLFGAQNNFSFKASQVKRFSIGKKGDIDKYTTKWRLNNRKVRRKLRTVISNYTARGANIGKSDVLYVLYYTASVFCIQEFLCASAIFASK
jgi:hypothetical protein